MIRKFILLFLLLLLVLLLVLVGGSFYLLGTDTGFRFTTSKLKEFVPALSIEAPTGNLERGVQTDQISWQQQGLQVDIKGLESKWTSVCLLQYRYCLDKLAVASVQIKSRPASTATGTSAPSVTLPEISLPISIEANEITIKELVLDLSETAPPVVIRNIQLRASMSGSKVDIAWLVADYQNFSARLEGSTELRDDYPLQAKLMLGARNVIDGQDLDLALSLEGTVRNLQVDGALSGAAQLHFAGHLQPLETGLPLDISADWQSLGWPLKQPVTVETRNAQLRLHGNLDDYALAFRSAVAGEHIPDSDIEIVGSVNPQRILLPSINLLTLDGYATGSAAANWQGTVTWVADLIAKEINPGIKWADMSGNLQALVQANGTVADGNWTLNVPKLDVTGSFREFPLDLDGRLNRQADDVWRVDSLALSVGPNKIDVQGNYGKQLDFDTTLDLPAIHYLTPKLAGNLAGKVKITGQPGQPSVQLSASSSVLKSGSVLLRNLRLDADVEQAANLASKLELDVGKLYASGQQAQNIKINLGGTRGSHNISAFADGPSQSSIRFAGSGSLSDTFDWQGMLESSTVELPANSFSLAQPVALAWQRDTGRFRVAAHCWNMQEARLCLQDTLDAGADGRALLSLDDYSLKYLNPFLPASAQLSGKLRARTDFSWQADKDQAFTATLDSDIENGTITVTDEELHQHVFEYQRLTLAATADPYTIGANLSIESEATGNGNASLTMNPKNEAQSIAGDVSLRGFNIGFLRAFMPDFDEVGGNLSISGAITGTLPEPVFTGRVALENIVLQSPALPLSIDGGKLGADIIGERATLDGELQSGKGTIRIGGNANWKNQLPTAVVTIDGESLSIVQSPVVQSTVFPSLRLRISPDQLAISGNVSVPAAIINIKSLPEGTTSLSNDVVIIEDELLQEQAPEQSRFAMRIDVGVTLGEKVQLSGYGIAAKLQGEFNVARRSDDPLQLNGEIRVSEGFYKSYGQDLSIKDGQILFIGPIERTTLNIDAVREIESENRIAGLHLEGPIADPQVTLFTTPADKSQESILSYIVLGRDLGTPSTASESSLLASAALALTLKQGKGFATGFAESLGISDFALEADGSGDETQVVVSGRLSSRLLLRYGRSVFSNEETLYLRYDISRKLYLEAAQSFDRAVDLFYSFSF